MLDFCSQKCKPDCSTKKYLIELKEPVVDEPNQLKHNVKIEFEHNSIPDIIIRYSFEMTLMSLVWNFGGLLGMWLGFSILFISKDIFDTFRRIIEFDKSKAIFIKFKICNFQFFTKKTSNAPAHRNNYPIFEIDY